jgi:hypothetical protein
MARFTPRARPAADEADGPVAPPQPKPSAKVIVASKLPMAIELQHCEMREVVRRVRETVWKDNEAAKVGPIVRINGTAYPRGQPPEGFRDRPTMIGGYALTFGVDRAWWEKWADQNKDAPFVANGLVFAVKDRADVMARAKGELQGVTSGLDPVVPPKDGQTTDPRMPRPIKGITVSGEAGPTDVDAA